MERQLSRSAVAEGFGWSSGCLAALASPSLEPVFLYEPPVGANRDATVRQRWQFVQVLAWRALGQRRRALQTFWRMVSERDDGTAGFDALTAELRAVLLGYRAPFVRALFCATELPPWRAGLRVHVALGGRSAAPRRRAVERLGQVASVDVLEGLDHLGPLTHPEAIVRWVERRRRGPEPQLTPRPE